MRLILGLVLLIVALVGVVVGANVLPASGALTPIATMGPQACARVDVFAGTEDVDVDPSRGQVFVSASDRRAASPDQGGIYLITLEGLDGAPSAARKVSLDGPADFQPHGIHLWIGRDGARRLFAISHPVAGGDVVEIFDVAEDGGLTHVRSVSDPAVSAPNDVVGVGPESFYVTNDRAFRTGPLSMAEAYLSLPLSSLAYFDGAVGRKVAGGLAFSNGIVVSPGGRTLYATEFLGRRVSVYDRDVGTGALSLTDRFPLSTGPDNVALGADGALYIAAHPQVFAFLGHARDAAVISPSEVVRIDPATGKPIRIWANTDGLLNASSVAAPIGGSLIIGAVFDGHVLVCPLPDAS